MVLILLSCWMLLSGVIELVWVSVIRLYSVVI